MTFRETLRAALLDHRAVMIGCTIGLLIGVVIVTPALIDVHEALDRTTVALDEAESRDDVLRCAFSISLRDDLTEKEQRRLFIQLCDVDPAVIPPQATTTTTKPRRR